MSGRLDQLGASGSELLRRGLAWWLVELKGMLPARLAGKSRNAPATLEVSATAAALVLTDRRSPQTQPVVLDADDAEAMRGQVQTALRRRTSNAVVIRLDQSLLLRTTVTLPLAAAANLRPILQNQLDRLVPLPADQVYFEHRILERSPAARTLTAELIVATRDSVDRSVALARSAGLQPRLVVAADDRGEASDGPVILWRADRAGGTSRTQLVMRRTLEVAIALLLAASLWVYLDRLDNLRDELREDVQLATRAAAAARDLVRRQGQTEATLAVLQRRQAEPTPLAILNEITAVVPETMWVSQLLLRGRNVEIIGFSPRVSDLLTRINGSDLFTNLQFRSPITRSADGKGERFDLSFDAGVEERK